MAVQHQCRSTILSTIIKVKYDWARLMLGWVIKYSLPKKQCTKFSNEKSSVFFPVKLLEILHASTYDLYNYIYKVKKIRRLVVRGRQPPPAAAGQRGTRAHYNCAI